MAFLALIGVVGVAAYAGRDKNSDATVLSGGTVPPTESTVPAVPPSEATTTAPAVAEATAPLVATEPPTTTTTISAVPDGCPAPDGSAPRTTKFAASPPMCIDPTRTYTATMRTSKGTMTFALNAAAAPKTVNNFIVLSRFHFYDGLTFHRVVPKFIAQGGDPLGTGEGDPGYRFADELPTAGAYKVGSLVMAKFDEEPDSNGSQFFIAIGELATQLPPNYSLFGQLVDGKDVVAAIEKVGSADGKPKEEVTIQAITIAENGTDLGSPGSTESTSPIVAPADSAPVGAGAAKASTTVAADSSVSVQ